MENNNLKKYPVLTQVLMKGQSQQLPKGNQLHREKFREILKGKSKTL